jgi:CheY-like chemotaxis protein
MATTTFTKTLGKRVLLVDDDPSARQSIKLLLSIDRHAVTEAENGPAALQIFANQPFDLVILDYAMPQMQGGELTALIKQVKPRQPILMITAYVEKLVVSDAPVDAILGKPFGIDDLRQAISKLLG